MKQFIIISLLLVAGTSFAARSVQYQAWLINNGHDISTVKFKGTYDPNGSIDTPIVKTWPEGVSIPADVALPSVEDSKGIVTESRIPFAAELQQLSASLDALVFAELGEHIDGTDEQLARLSALVVSSLESNRIEYAAAETLAELKAAGTRINNLRSIVSLQAKIVSLRE